MNRTALVDTNGQVINIVPGLPSDYEPMEGITYLNITGIPDVYAGENVGDPGFFPPNYKLITKFAFRNRFTMEEKVAIYMAAEQNILMKVWLDDLATAEYVDLGLPSVIASLEAMVTATILTEARKDEILNTLITSAERA
jgi:hypothetical protein